MKKIKFKTLILAILIFCVVVVSIVILLTKDETKYSEDSIDNTAINTEKVKELPTLSTISPNLDITIQCLPTLLCDYKTGDASFYFTIPETSDTVVKAEVYVGKDSLPNHFSNTMEYLFSNNRYTREHGFIKIAETGLLEPGKTIEKIHLEQTPTKLTEVWIRYVAYEKDSKISKGSFIQPTTIFVVDNKGSILNQNGKWQKNSIDLE